MAPITRRVHLINKQSTNVKSTVCNPHHDNVNTVTNATSFCMCAEESRSRHCSEVLCVDQYLSPSVLKPWPCSHLAFTCVLGVPIISFMYISSNTSHYNASQFHDLYANKYLFAQTKLVFIAIFLHKFNI